MLKRKRKRKSDVHTINQSIKLFVVGKHAIFSVKKGGGRKKGCTALRDHNRIVY